jgi:hypothetical protein
LVCFSIVFYGFPPNTNFGSASTNSNYGTALRISVIIFTAIIFSITMIDSKSRILPLTKWGKIWISSTIIVFASFSLVYFDFIVEGVGIGSYFLLGVFVNSLLSFAAGRKLDSKRRQQENNGKENQTMQKLKPAS